MTSKMDTGRLRRMVATTSDVELRLVVEDLLVDVVSRVRLLEGAAERRAFDEDLRVVQKAVRGWRNVAPNAAQTKACFELLLEIAERIGAS